MILMPAGALACTCEGGPTSLILPFSISTAAGESTFPVRGSSRRPAFTRVRGAGDWAASCPAENRVKNNATNSANRLCMRFSPPNHHRTATPRTLRPELFVSQRHHWIDAYRSPRWDITGQHSDTDEGYSNTGKRHGSCRPHAIKQACHQVRHDHRTNKPYRSTGNSQSQSLTQDH